MPCEKLQLLDARPSSEAELLLCVECCRERFPGPLAGELLALLNEHLPEAFPEEEDEEEAGGGGAE